jgi:hypothetical protein
MNTIRITFYFKSNLGKGRRKKAEVRRKKAEGRRKKEEGRRISMSPDLRTSNSEPLNEPRTSNGPGERRPVNAELCIDKSGDAGWWNE